jgi:hypothetical protein
MIEEIGDFTSFNPYKMKVMLEEDFGDKIEAHS